MSSRTGKVHVAVTRRHYKDKVYETFLLRRSYREGGKVKTETVGNISHLPRPTIELIRRSLAGETAFSETALEVQRSLAHGHVATVLGLLRKLGLERMVDPADSRQRRLVVGMVVARLLHSESKLETTRWWQETTLPAVLGIEDANEDDLYQALDWLRERQEAIEKRLARRHLQPGSMVLYDLSSSYVEGSHCALAKFGYSRDRKKGKRQVEYGLLTDAEGRPVAVEVFSGNTGDPTTVEVQLEKLQQRFRLKELVLVGDRGMLTQTRIDTLRERGVGWISALRSPQIRQLVQNGSLQLGLFDERNLAEIEDPDYPGERLVVCRNPLLAKERTRKRQDLLQATEEQLSPLVERVVRGQLQGSGAIGMAVGRVVNRHKVGKHFQVDITDRQLRFQRKEAEIAAEAQLDGIYVLRTSVPAAEMESAEVVRSYKRLTKVERDFRALKTFDLHVRPIRHWNEGRVRAHIFLCMLALYVRWHLEQAWAPLLFRDEQRPVAEDPVVPALRSAAALRKVTTRRLEDGTQVHSLASLLGHLASLDRTSVVPTGADGSATFELPNRPTPLQEKALNLLALTSAVLK